jgi:predicted anti-sigma-YlaC factor YlaD
MKCEEIREQMFDLMMAEGAHAPEVQTHLNGCAACSAELASMKQTMALLDEWQTPEVSPFFDTRLQALVREEKAKAAEKQSWIFDWFRKPVLAAAAAVALVVGAGVYAGLQNTHPPVTTINTIAAGDPAIKDLQTLDNDQDVINNFAALDDDPTNDDQSAGTAE